MKCPHCKKAELCQIMGDEPWTIDHLQCPECDSTYNTRKEAALASQSPENTDTQKWRCPNCAAGAQSLVYAEDISVYYAEVTIEGKKAYVDSPSNDYSCPTNQRLFCTSCDTYHVDEDSDNAGTSLLEVHYR
jgi:transposase-like protein